MSNVYCEYNHYITVKGYSTAEIVEVQFNSANESVASWIDMQNNGYNVFESYPSTPSRVLAIACELIDIWFNFIEHRQSLLELGFRDWTETIPEHYEKMIRNEFDKNFQL